MATGKTGATVQLPGGFQTPDPTLVLGQIRWKRALGLPTGDLKAAFGIRCYHHTSTPAELAAPFRSGLEGLAAVSASVCGASKGSLALRSVAPATCALAQRCFNRGLIQACMPRAGQTDGDTR